MRASRAGQAGMTLIEIMIALAILGLMMTIAWKTITNTSNARRTFVAIEERNHEIRVALARVAADLESAYLSLNEDSNADVSQRRTLFVGKSGGDVPELRFSSLCHTPLWADANESEQTQIAYYAAPDRDDPSKKNWLRRELRRPSNEPWKEQPADIDVLLRDVDKVTFDYFDWKDADWQDSWDSTSSDAEKNRLPSRVRITVTFKNPRGEEVKLTTEARILMQEPLNFQTSANE